MVWIVDDSPGDAERARRALAPHHQTRVFSDGSAVLEALASEAPPDLLVLDWVMPGVTGIEVCQFVRQSSPEAQTAILLLTARQDPEQVATALAQGANDYLCKPYAEVELVARVGALLRNRDLLERLTRAEENVRRLLSSAPDPLIAVDREGRISFASEEAERLFGAPPHGLVGRSIEETLPGLSLQSLTAGSLPSALPRLDDVTVGEQIFAPTIRVLPSDFAASTTIALHNVTARRREEARRLDFYSVIAHDLRSPLNAMLLRTELMLRGTRGPLPTPALGDLRKIEGHIRSLVALINDFLELAGMEGASYRIERDPVDVIELVRKTMEDVQPLVDESRLSARMVIEGGEAAVDAAHIIGDRRRLTQVLVNLLSNAVKFTAAEGRITVAVTARSQDVQVRVSDTGRGIHPEALSRLFRRYARISPADREPVMGTGLGLMIVREIVEAHGGTVGVESEPGRGSTFWFRLPRSDARPAQVAEPSQPSILIVDDDDDVRASLRFVLEAAGYHVLDAANGKEGLDLMSEHRPCVAVVDLDMPVVNGWEFVDRLRVDSDRTQLPVCVISGQAANAPEGVACVLEKPIRVEDLLGFVACHCPASQANHDGGAKAPRFAPRDRFPAGEPSLRRS